MYSKVIKKNEIVPFSARWMDLEIILLSEVSQMDSCDLDSHDCPVWTPDWAPRGPDSFLLQSFAPCEPSSPTVLASVSLGWKIPIHSQCHIEDSPVLVPFPGPWICGDLPSQVPLALCGQLSPDLSRTLIPRPLPPCSAAWGLGLCTSDLCVTRVL